MTCRTCIKLFSTHMLILTTRHAVDPCVQTGGLRGAHTLLGARSCIHIEPKPGFGIGVLYNAHIGHAAAADTTNRLKATLMGSCVRRML